MVIVAVILWHCFIWAVAGPAAAFFSSITGLAVVVLAMWEAGSRKRTPKAPDPAE